MTLFITKMVFLILFCLSLISAQENNCQVTNQDGEEKYCQFPFVHKDRIFYGCTIFDDINDKQWCVTKTFQNCSWDLESGEWGYCSSEKCPYNKDYHDDDHDYYAYDKEHYKTQLQMTSLFCPPEELVTDRELGTWQPDGSKYQCGYSDSISHIVGGSDTKPQEYPWMALLGYQGQYLCGGSLINKWYILTAAHCVLEDKPE